MSKDIVDLIKAQGNQACVMIPDIMDIPAIDLGKVEINEGVENIELSTDQKQQLIDFIDKNNCRFLLEFKSQEMQSKLSMVLTGKSEGDALSLYAYTSFPSGVADGSHSTVDIFMITVFKVEGMTDVAFGFKQLK